MVITLVADSKTKERKPRQCRGCLQNGHEIRNCPALSNEEKEKYKRRNLEQAGCDKNMAEPKRGRTEAEIDKKTTEIEDIEDEGDEDKEEVVTRSILNPFVDGAGGEAEEEDEKKDDSVVDLAKLGEFKPVATPPIVDFAGGSRSGFVDRELPRYSASVGTNLL